jgi:hypothetical protein
MAKVIINPEIEYYIVSLKHTHTKDKYTTLWRPNNAGYCWMVSSAGKYNGYQIGYHKDPENFPIRVADIPNKFYVLDSDCRQCIVNNRTSRAFFKNYSDQVINSKNV